MGLSHDIRDLIEYEKFLADFPETTNRAVAISMNEVLSGVGLGRYKQGIEREVNFPAGYVGGDRLYQDTKATPSRLTASIIGRQRATSLARFATTGAIGSKGGVRVQVKKGGGTALFKSGFLVRLKAGTSLENGNVGLAVRLAPGQVLNKKDTSRMVHLESNVVLLYGPSIDQVLRTEVAASESPKVLTDMTTEFFRQFARLSRG